MSTPLLDIEGLNVSFRGAKTWLPAVRDVSMAVHPGESLAIVGESGSGKSVSMMAVMGILPWTARVDAKRLQFEGKDMTAGRGREGIVGKSMSMIFQEPMSSLNPCMTVSDQIDESLRQHLGMAKNERRERVLDLLAEVGIPDPKGRAGAYPHQLSGGMSQRVMIAMALAARPKLLIADEPTTALDVTIQAQILALLLGLQEQYGMALVLITHDLGVVAEVAKRVFVQYAGEQVEQAEVESLLNAPRHPYTRALLGALPERAKKGERLPTIAGMVPKLDQLPDGCTFAPRCAHARPTCRQSAPVMNQQVRCHFPLTNTEVSA